MDKNLETIERNILKTFFETVIAIEPLDNSISDNVLVRKTQNKLRAALKGALVRCTCAKSHRGVKVMCETCQGSDNEMVYLRNFYQVIRKAKKLKISAEFLGGLVTTTKNQLLNS